MALIRKSGDRVEGVPVWEAESNRYAVKPFGLKVPRTRDRGSCELAFPEVSKFGLHGIEGDGLPIASADE